METLKHECGVAMIRLRKPLSYHQDQYGTWQHRRLEQTVESNR